VNLNNAAVEEEFELFPGEDSLFTVCVHRGNDVQHFDIVVFHSDNLFYFVHEAIVRDGRRLRHGLEFDLGTPVSLHFYYLVVVVFEYLWLEEDDLRDADLPPIFLDPRLYNLILEVSNRGELSDVIFEIFKPAAVRVLR